MNTTVVGLRTYSYAYSLKQSTVTAFTQQILATVKLRQRLKLQRMNTSTASSNFRITS